MAVTSANRVRFSFSLKVKCDYENNANLEPIERAKPITSQHVCFG